MRAGLSGLSNMKRCRCGWALLKQEGGKKFGRRSSMINVAGPEEKGALEEGKMKILKIKISSH